MKAIVQAFCPLLLLLGAAAASAQVPPGAPKPDIVLRGSIAGGDNHSYKLVPFNVPDGVRRITFSLTYTGREQRTVIDVGLLDPQGFRGWSGGRPGPFTVSETDASPSYLPGKIVPGTWSLLLGIPNIRPDSTATFAGEIYFSRTDNAADPNAGIYPVLNREPRWYRGDLHMHTAHSDGSCSSQDGKKVPCPLFVTVDAAARRGLDFIAITDHNTIAQYDAMRELQPYFDRLLLIPGREITTFQGHANVFGVTGFINFRVGSREVPSWNAVLDQVSAAGGLVSINHPKDPTGESCMGCGWAATPPVDMRRVPAVEAINGADAESSRAGIPFWQEQLNLGYRLTAIGGSDNHNGSAPLPGPGSVGYPTTVVYARELSVGGILDAIRAGHVFLDVTGSKDRLLEMSARAANSQAAMGDEINLASGTSADFTVHVMHAGSGRVEIIQDGTPSSVLANGVISQEDQTISFPWKSDGRRHWLRANVRDVEGKLLLVGNPIYINFDQGAKPAEGN